MVSKGKGGTQHSSLIELMFTVFELESEIAGKMGKEHIFLFGYTGDSKKK